jgi:hypothetical protein
MECSKFRESECSVIVPTSRRDGWSLMDNNIHRSEQNWVFRCETVQPTRRDPPANSYSVIPALDDRHSAMAMTVEWS